MGRLINHCISATEEANGTPSSARIYAGILLVTIPMIQIMVVLAIMTRLLSLNPTLQSAPALTSYFLGFLKSFLLWTLLFDASTALSLYGINVWKYLVALRTGVAPVEPPPLGDACAPPPAPASSPEPTQTTNGSSSDIPQDADRT